MKKPSEADKCNAVAAEIFTGFQAYRADFQIITNGARARFENRDWAGVQRAGEERLTIYRSHLDTVVAAIAAIMADVQLRAGLWRATKAAYLKLIANHYNAELFETFYNSAHLRSKHKSRNSVDTSSRDSQRPP